MLILGLLSIIQICFIPGFLVLSTLRLCEGFIKTILISFSLSLILNHLLVAVCVLLHIYKPVTLYFIFVTEIGFLIYLYRQSLNNPIKSIINSDLTRFKDIISIINTYNIPSKALCYLLIFIVTLSIAYFLNCAFRTFGQIFDVWDSVVSWNRWAVDWANGKFPQLTWHYPQLIPANWSISYLFINDSTVQFYARAIMAFFPLAIIFIFVDLWLRKNLIGYLLGAVISGFLMLLLNGTVFLTSGYADIPVAYMSFVPFYILLISDKFECSSHFNNSMIVAAICCAGAALTKQAGIFACLVFPVIYCVTSLQDCPLDNKKKARLLFKQSSVLLLVILPWYIYNELSIISKNNSSEIEYVTNIIFQDKTLLERFYSSLDMLILGFSTFPTITTLVGKFSILPMKHNLLGILFTILLFASFSVYNRSWRYLFFCLVLPFYCIWTLFFSYDTRNLSLVIPFAGGAAGLGGINFCRTIYDNSSRLFNVRIFMAIIFSIGLLIPIDYLFSRESINKRQLTLQKQIGDPKVNRILYDYQNAHGINGKIVSNYQLLKYLPILGEYYQLHYFRKIKEIVTIVNDPNINFMLININPQVPLETLEYINKLIHEGKLTELPSVDGYKFVRKSIK